ncbi:MAG TPA: type ISP restriction/modification enzyme [Sedimentisphaerales bacterium]|nr:type ISP restriction/modification enzyme [Sedimentisphaerales bacterium]
MKKRGYLNQGTGPFDDMLKTYIKEVFKVVKTGDAREESYYKALATLLETFALSIKKTKTQVTISPKKTEAGNPDLRVWDGRQHIVGYVEAKRPEEENLDRIEESEQLKRYRRAFANVILTNFFEFRLYRQGQLIDRVEIARPFVARELKVAPPLENEERFLDLLNKFFTFSLPQKYTPKTLAEALASRTHYLRQQVLLELATGNGDLTGFYQAFQKHLIGALTEEEFADMYAQTVAYGLFAARTRCKEEFTRRSAFDNIPKTIGILRDVFRFVSLQDTGPELNWIIDDITDVLAVADVKKILHEYFVSGRGQDPIMHFYETFLVEYDPKERELRGVYYTPQEVVSYIVRSLNTILQEYFGRPDGFATDSVTVLDPAAGTLTFPAEAAKLAVNEFSARYGTGGVTELIRRHILKNFCAFELMMAPYAIAHLKIGFLLEELGYSLGEDERFKLYLTNTLEFEQLAETRFPGMSSLCEESHAAAAVKRDTPILVILGNPPYSGHSANKGPWISKEIREYYRVDGKDLGERNPKWLQDDYVKFIRFAQWKIDQAGEGVLGFITNHSYLDNPTFRGMRQSLMNSFDHIFLLDLHGNAKKKEKCPDGSKDENVFDIQQGVAIILAVKRPGLRKNISHAHSWGTREAKSNWLKSNDVKTTRWKKLTPKSEFYFFVPRDEKLLSSYEKYLKVTDIFPVNSVGVVTSRDKFAIDPDKSQLAKRIRMFFDESLSDAVIKQAFNLRDKSGWNTKNARRKIMADEHWEEQILPILYRPFDQQWILYNDAVIERTRKEVMRHMRHANLALCVGRAGQVVGSEKPWNIVFCAECIEDLNLFYRGGNVNFPLYLYPEEDLYNGAERYERQVNIAPGVVEALKKAYGGKTTPEDIFYYVYAILYSNAYRTRFAEFLKTDFPRIPFSQDRKSFQTMGKLGKNLVELHLMKSTKLNKPIAKYEGKGDNLVEKVSYDEKKKLVHINKGRHFGPINKNIWEYRIGGYQVMAKWLNDRKGRRLVLDDIKHYCRIAAAIKHTISAQKKIDEIYVSIEKACIAIQPAR